MALVISYEKNVVAFRLERFAGWASHPLESAAFSRRTPNVVISGFDDSARATSEVDTPRRSWPRRRLITKPSKGDDHVSWSSSALASCSAGVSKPSVNQP
jgi:hypothetical protein